MKASLFILFLLNLSIASYSQSSKWPDVSKKEDLKALNTGKLFCKDNSILKDVNLFEVKDFWIIFVKNESLHDLEIDKIDRIEFPESYWGPIKLEFMGNKPRFSVLITNKSL